MICYLLTKHVLHCITNRCSVGVNDVCYFRIVIESIGEQTGAADGGE